MIAVLKLYIIDIYFRVALPPEALHSTVLEIDEGQKVHSEERRGQSDKSNKDKYDVRDVVPRKIKISKGSSLSVSKSDDLVDEELAKMEDAESLNEVTLRVCVNIQFRAGCKYKIPLM